MSRLSGLSTSSTSALRFTLEEPSSSNSTAGSVESTGASLTAATVTSTCPDARNPPGSVTVSVRRSVPFQFAPAEKLATPLVTATRTFRCPVNAQDISVGRLSGSDTYSVSVSDVEASSLNETAGTRASVGASLTGVTCTVNVVDARSLSGSLAWTDTVSGPPFQFSGADSVMRRVLRSSSARTLAGGVTATVRREFG